MPTYRGARSVITANGTTVCTGGGPTGNVPGLTYAGADSSYAYFTLLPGEWTVTATGT